MEGNGNNELDIGTLIYEALQESAAELRCSKKKKKEARRKKIKQLKHELKEAHELNTLSYGSFNSKEEKEAYEAFCDAHTECWESIGDYPYVQPYGAGGIAVGFYVVCPVCGQKKDISDTSKW